MVILKSNSQIQRIRKANQITRDVLNLMQDSIKVGITTKQLDKIACEYMQKCNSTPAFLGYQGFPGGICASVDEQIIHGIPSKNKYLEEGQIISIDTGAKYQGCVGDAARTFPVGKISELKQQLIEVTKQSFFEAIKVINELKLQTRIGDIGHAVENYVLPYGFSVVKEFVGHGVGAELHEDPQVPNYGSKARGMVLRENMTIAIEPMINAGKEDIEILEDGWTVVTLDRMPSAHYENSILITKEGAEILSL